MAYLKMKILNNDLDGISEMLLNQLQEKISDCRLIKGFKKTFGNDSIYVIIFDKHYERVNSRVSLTMLISKDEYNFIIVQAVTSGGAVGWIDLDWGAEKNYLKKVEKILLEIGFETEEIVLD